MRLVAYICADTYSYMKTSVVSYKSLGAAFRFIYTYMSGDSFFPYIYMYRSYVCMCGGKYTYAWNASGFRCVSRHLIAFRTPPICKQAESLLLKLRQWRPRSLALSVEYLLFPVILKLVYVGPACFQNRRGPNSCIHSLVRNEMKYVYTGSFSLYIYI